MPTLTLNSASANQTMTFGRHLGANLKGGEVIELISDLGGGKTTFIKGLVAGANSLEPVSSPTFTICNIYKAGRLTIYHFDFYRLSEPGLMGQALREALGDSTNVVVIEWPSAVSNLLPPGRLSLKLINMGPEDSRQLKFNYPKSRAYLLKGALK